jgi:BolA protein
MTDRIALIDVRLRQALAPERLQIIDDSAAHAGHPGAREGGHFRVVIVARAFTGKSLLQRHRLVYDAVRDLMQSHIHALSIRALTPEEG